MRGAERLVESLAGLGVEVVFGLPGVHNLAIWEALAHSNIALIGVRHEQSAVYAADGYARTTGTLGVAIVTTGPGAANTVAATGEAMASGTPVLVIATDIASDMRRPGTYRGVLHETRDQAAMFESVAKDARTAIAAESLAADLVAAANRATSSPNGPVYLGIPTDFLSATADPVGAVGDEGAATTMPADDDFDAAAGHLGPASRPLIVAGGGAVRADAGPAIAQLAERLAAPVVATYAAKGLLPPRHPLAVPATLHDRRVGRLWDEADVVVAIGTDLDGMTTQNWALPRPPKLLVINVDPRDGAKSYPPDLTLVGEADVITEMLAARLPARRSGDDIGGRLGTLETEVRDAIAADDPEALAFLDALRKTASDDVAVVADMCIPGYWLAGFHQPARPRRFAYPMGWGTLGFGFPASIGAALGDVDRAICVCGDGGFLFACGELATVAQEQLPLTVVVVDDGGYGMLRFDQARAGAEPFGVDLHTPDFVALARAFGIAASSIDGFGSAFRRELARSLATSGPSVIAVGAELSPPPNTSPRWYRTSGDAEERPAIASTNHSGGKR